MTLQLKKAAPTSLWRTRKEHPASEPQPQLQAPPTNNLGGGVDERATDLSQYFDNLPVDAYAIFRVEAIIGLDFSNFLHRYHRSGTPLSELITQECLEEVTYIIQTVNDNYETLDPIVTLAPEDDAIVINSVNDDTIDLSIKVITTIEGLVWLHDDAPNQGETGQTFIRIAPESVVLIERL